MTCNGTPSAGLVMDQTSLNPIDAAAVLVVLAAVFGYVNYTIVKLPHASGPTIMGARLARGGGDRCAGSRPTAPAHDGKSCCECPSCYHRRQPGRAIRGIGVECFHYFATIGG